MAERIKGYFLIIAITHPIYSILGALVYLSLPKSQQPERMPQAQQTGFAYGLCDGCGHPDVRICWFSICCHTVRWAANASSPKVNFFGLGFFPTLLIMEGSICLGAILICLGLAPFTWICSLVILVMYVLNRHKIRRVYGLPTWTCGSCMEASPSCKKRCSWNLSESRLHLASTEIELAARPALLMNAEPALRSILMDAGWRRANHPHHLLKFVAD